MFARKVSVRLKPNSLDKFTNLMEHEILPWLRRQKGFLDLITLALPDGSEVATISFWDQEDHAQAYNASGYPQVLEVLEEILDAIPYVKTFEVVGSTIPTLNPARPHNAGNLLHNPPAPLGCVSFETNL
jgi:heme-degrading monooxygenase HmoA